jgi:hypothetical protein
MAGRSNIIPFALAGAPRCAGCNARMSLMRSQPDPNGGRYMFEMFACVPCKSSWLKVRPIRRSKASRVCAFDRPRRFRSTG